MASRKRIWEGEESIESDDATECKSKRKISEKPLPSLQDAPFPSHQDAPLLSLQDVSSALPFFDNKAYLKARKEARIRDEHYERLYISEEKDRLRSEESDRKREAEYETRRAALRAAGVAFAELRYDEKDPNKDIMYKMNRIQGQIKHKKCVDEAKKTNV